jgi:hypothetical protein
MMSPSWKWRWQKMNQDYRQNPFSTFPAQLFLYWPISVFLLFFFFLLSYFSLYFNLEIWNIQKIYNSSFLENLSLIVINIWTKNSPRLEFIFFIHLFTCAYIVWVISPPYPLSHPLSPSTSQFQAGPVLPLSLILLKRRHKHNKEDKAFLLAELRIAIQRFLTLLLCTRVIIHVDSSLTHLYIGSWSHSHVNLCLFKVSVLAPLE